MKPAQYEIPIVIEPENLKPHIRLNRNQTFSSTQRIRVTQNVFTKDYLPNDSRLKEQRIPIQLKINKERNPDSLDWILQSNYNHAEDQFASKTQIFRTRDKNDKPSTENFYEGDVDFEPRSHLYRNKDSLLIETSTDIPNIHALTVPRTKQGFSRNPNGSFYWE